MSDRKARLAALAAKAGRTSKQPPSPSAAADEGHEGPSSSKMKDVKFRNYTPADASLDQNRGREEEPIAKRPRTTTAEVDAPSVLETALAKARAEVKTTKAAEAAPRKINWDLKRDIQPKLNKLEKRTQKAIVSLLKDRLEHEAAAEVADDDDDNLD